MKYYELPLLGSTRYIIPFEIEMVQLNLLLTMYYHFKEVFIVITTSVYTKKVIRKINEGK